MSSLQRRQPLVLVLAIALAVAGIFAGGSAPASTRAASGYALDLYRPGDFVSQTNLVQCVGASMQMMINIMAPTDDTTAETQHRLWTLARSFRSIPPRPGNQVRRGASVRGWSLGLNAEGYGPYRVIGFGSIEEATKAAARSMRRTGKPVGLLVWGGRHAWVMSGFSATADPLTTDSFAVTGAAVLDPLYPRHSLTWGRSPAPNTRLSLADLGHYFVERRRSSRSGSLAGKWVIVMPVSLNGPRAQGQPLAG